MLISACLVGQCCRWDAQNGKSIVNRRLHGMLNAGEIAALCPECAGGLDVPRAPAEIEPGKTAQDVLEGRGRVINSNGEDVTEAFVCGAQKTLEKALSGNVKVALLKARSPSCSPEEHYDGHFSHTLTAGPGVTAALLKAHGITLFDETQLDAALSHLDSL